MGCGRAGRPAGGGRARATVPCPVGERARTPRRCTPLHRTLTLAASCHRPDRAAVGPRGPPPAACAAAARGAAPTTGVIVSRAVTFGLGFSICSPPSWGPSSSMALGSARLLHAPCPTRNGGGGLAGGSVATSCRRERGPTPLAALVTRWSRGSCPSEALPGRRPSCHSPAAAAPTPAGHTL